MEEIAWDVKEQVFAQSVRELGIADYNPQQELFRNIRKELTSQIED
jgi:hypothetical protein